ncbi:spore germination protein KB [Melghirimyces profundicolus]|uniref:Spore germination protein KB n=1 Tax=Melghirimyces profundicolus TaxID=1242148 RepID=A0A2T6BTF8_9BACL|nr:endospore germination permease [Melghirimyces profundicolus]PTX59344.1 spore germination protein KB [Melghirimyces profundicolus]
MERESISPFQLFLLVMLFELGSAVVVPLGLDAKQDAWIAILLALVPAVGLIWLYSFLHRRYPNRTLIGTLQTLLGKPTGWTVGLLYVTYFMYIATRVLRDFAELLDASFFPQTPMMIETVLMVFSIAYVVSLGIDVIAKTGQIFACLYLLSLLVAVLLLLFSGAVEMESLQPVAEDWKRIFEAAFPVVYTFPFGEMIVFTMLFPYVRPKSNVMGTAIGAMVLSGLVISLVVATEIAALGANIVSRGSFPLLTTIAKVNIADFIQRVEVLALLILIVGLFFKIALFFYAALIGAAELFRRKSHQPLVLPFSIILILLSMMIAGNLPEHIQEGLKAVPWYLHLPMQTGLPVLLSIIALIRGRSRKAGV